MMDAIIAAAHLAPPRCACDVQATAAVDAYLRLPIIMCFSAVVNSRLLDNGVRSCACPQQPCHQVGTPL